MGLTFENFCHRRGRRSESIAETRVAVRSHPPPGVRAPRQNRPVSMPRKLTTSARHIKRFAIDYSLVHLGLSMDSIVNVRHGTCAHNCLQVSLSSFQITTHLRHGASAHVGPSRQIREELGSGVVGKACELGGEQVRRILRGACGGHQAARATGRPPTQHGSRHEPAQVRARCHSAATMVRAQGSGGAG